MYRLEILQISMIFASRSKSSLFINIENKAIGFQIVIVEREEGRRGQYSIKDRSVK